MTALATAYVRLRVDGSQVGPGIKSSLASPAASTAATTAGKDTGKKFATGFGSSLKSLAVGFGAGLGISALVGELKNVTAEGREAQKSSALTNAVLQSTGGVAGVSAKQVADLASALSLKIGVDDEAIQSGENMLLTFTNVRNEVGAGNDIFNQATVAVQDMAAAFGGDAVSNSKLLGKALNDPVAGLTALTRVGVAFTAQQKEQIAALVATGDTLGAQKVILGEITKETAGAAESQATAGDKAKVAWQNLEEELSTKLLPALDNVETWFATDGINGIKAFGGFLDSDVIPPLQLLANVGGDVIGVFNSLPGPAKEAAFALGLASLAARKFDLGSKGASIGAGLKSGLEGIHFQGLLVQESMGKATTTTGKFGAATAAAARGGLSAMTKGVGGIVSLLGGPWGLALAGAAVGISILAKESADAAARQAELNSIAATLTGTLNKQTGAATAATYTSIIADLQDVTFSANDAGIALETIARAATGNASAFDSIASSLGLTSAELKLQVGLAAAIPALYKDATLSGVTLSGTQRDVVLGLAKETRGFGEAGEAARLSAGAHDEYSGKAKGAEASARALGSATGNTAKAFDTQTGSVDGSTKALEGYRSVAADILGRQIGLAQAIDDARKAAKEQEDGFNKNKQAGRDNLQTILDLAQATDGFTSKTKLGRAALGDARKAIIDFATAQGKSIPEAKEMAARLLGVADGAKEINRNPAKVKVSESGADEAKQKVLDVGAALRGIDGSSATVNIHALLSVAQTAFNAINPFHNASGSITREPQTTKRPILWGEAGPEAYIPLVTAGDARHGRALNLWKETGKQLGAMALANGDVFTVGGLSESKSDHLLSQIKDNTSDARDHLRDLLTSQRDLSRSIAGTFDTATFGEGAPATARDLFLRARAQVNDDKLFRHVLGRLKAKGANPSLLSALAEAGPGAIVQAQALAGLSRRELNRYENLLGAGRREAGGIGDFVSHQVFDRRVNQARDKVDDLSDSLNRFRKRLDNLPKEIGHEVSKSIDGASVTMDGRRVGEVLARTADRRNRGG